MISFYDGQITDIMPENFYSKPEVQAISYALREGTRMLSRHAQRMYIYAAIDRQPDDVLDLLAAELRTQYYRDTLDITTKRRLVKNTLAWYMRAGTPEAVEELAAAVFGEGKVKEWFEYGDGPYYFKIITNALLTPETDSFFSYMLRRVKNTRSHLRAVEVHRTVDQGLYAGAAVLPNYRPPAVMDGYAFRQETGQTVHTGFLTSAQAHPVPVRDGFKIDASVTMGTYTGILGLPKTHPAAIGDGYRQENTAGGEASSGTAAASTEKQVAIREALKGRAEPVGTQISIGTAESAASQKPAAVHDGFRYHGKAVSTETYSGAAPDSRYKNTVG